MNQTNLKTIVSYQLKNYKAAILWMYLTLFAISILLFTTVSSNSSLNNNGLEFASLVAIFIFGLNSFKEDFKFFSANGISRKTQFCSTVLSLSVLSVIFALIDTICTILFTRMKVSQPMVLLMYSPRYGYDFNAVFNQAGLNLTPQFLLESFLWIFFAGLFLAAFGLLITSLFYRMGKGLKIAVSIGFFVVIFDVLPLLDQLYFGGVLVKTILNAIVIALGLSGQCNPYTAMLSFFLLSCATFALTFLTVRSASIKK
jgi:hypothetical protein